MSLFRSLHALQSEAGKCDCVRVQGKVVRGTLCGLGVAVRVAPDLLTLSLMLNLAVPQWADIGWGGDLGTTSA